MLLGGGLDQALRFSLIEKKANLFLCDYFQDFPSGEFENKLTKPPLPNLGLFWDWKKENVKTKIEQEIISKGD